MNDIINNAVKYLSGIVLMTNDIVNIVKGIIGSPSLLAQDEVESSDGNLYGTYLFFIFVLSYSSMK